MGVNQHQRLRPAYPTPGGVASVVDGTAVFIARGAANGFYVGSGTTDWWVSVRDNNTPGTLNDTNATPMMAGPAGIVYGPFEFGGTDKYVAVAGRGGAGTVVVTLV